MSRHVRRLGKYLLGTKLPPLNTAKALESWIAREDGTDNFRVVRALQFPKDPLDCPYEIQVARQNIHQEFLHLQVLDGEPGICKQYGLFQEITLSEKEEEIHRVYLVLDCYARHDFSPAFTVIKNLYECLKDLKRIPEDAAIRLFVKCLQIVSKIHENGIVHRDLTLTNFVLNQNTGEIQLVNFGVGRLLTHENELLAIQPGAPLYFSPEIVKGKPYLGKPSDMWSLGVMFYAMLFATYPFPTCNLPTLCSKISKSEYTFPNAVSAKTMWVIQGLFRLNPSERLTCDQALNELLSVDIISNPEVQVVPEIFPPPKHREEPLKHPVKTPYTLTVDKQDSMPLSLRQVKIFHDFMFRKQNQRVLATFT